MMWFDDSKFVTVLFTHDDIIWDYINIHIQRDSFEYFNTKTNVKLFIPLLHEINVEESYTMKIASNIVLKLCKTINCDWDTLSNCADTFIIKRPEKYYIS
jgi:hypothetical protein